MKVFEGSDHEFYMDGYLKNALDTAKKEIKNDWDFVFVYDGTEGGGKSVKVMQDAFYCDPTLNFDRYAFTPKQFKEAVLKAEKFQAVVYDEAHSGLNSRAAMTQINRSLISMLTEIRQKNLFVFIILPTFFDLERYVGIWRSRALIHIYTKESFQRGYFAFYNVERKKDLYLKGKKLYQYSVVKPNFIGRFTNFYPLDQAEYRKRKAEALANRDEPDDDAATIKKAEELLWDRLFNVKWLTNIQKCELIGISEQTFYNRMKKIENRVD